MTSSITTPGRWQFSIRDLMALTTMVAVVLAWHRLLEGVLPENLWLEEDRTVGDIFRERYYPGLFLIPVTVALLFWSCHMSKCRSDVMSALALIVIAWLLTSFNALERFVYASMIINNHVAPMERQFNFNQILFSSVSLPVFATMPAIYCLWGRFKFPNYQKTILCGSVLFVVVDMLMVFYLLSRTFGIYGPYYRPSTASWILY